MADDIFEEVESEELDKELEAESEAEPVNDEKEAPPSGDKAGEDKEAKEEEQVTFADLQEKIKELEKESIGRLKDLRSEREKRQALEAKVSTVTELIARSRAPKEAEPTEAEETVKAGKKTIPVKFDDNGDPYIDVDDLKGLTASEVKSVEKQLGDKIDRLEQNDVSTAQQLRIVNEVKSVLSMDEAYPQAFGKLEEAFQMMDQRVTALIERRGIDPKGLDLDQCIEILESDKTFMKEFKSKYPSVDVDTVIEARALTPSNRVNRRKMVRALDALKSTTETANGGAKPEDKKGGLSKTLKALTSARNLAGVKNQKGTRETSLVDLAELDIDDFMSLKDSDIKELERALRDDELGG